MCETEPLFHLPLERSKPIRNARYVRCMVCANREYRWTEKMPIREPDATDVDELILKAMRRLTEADVTQRDESILKKKDEGGEIGLSEHSIANHLSEQGHGIPLSTARKRLSTLEDKGLVRIERTSRSLAYHYLVEREE